MSGIPPSFSFYVVSRSVILLLTRPLTPPPSPPPTSGDDNRKYLFMSSNIILSFAFNPALLWDLLILFERNLGPYNCSTRWDSAVLNSRCIDVPLPSQFRVMSAFLKLYLNDNFSFYWWNFRWHNHSVRKIRGGITNHLLTAILFRKKKYRI